MLLLLCCPKDAEVANAMREVAAILVCTCGAQEVVAELGFVDEGELEEVVRHKMPCISMTDWYGMPSSEEGEKKKEEEGEA